MGREHLLADAYLRVERPAEHIAEAEKVIEATADEFVSATVSYTEEEWDVERLIPDPPDAFPALRRIAILAGEVIYNLRAALDYLVFALAMQDSGPRFPGGSKFPRGTQFPIDDDGEVFLRHRVSYLRWVSDAHAVAIATLQPYQGCRWTRTLRTLSNKDKHRRLTQSVSVTSFTTEFVPYPNITPEVGAPVGELRFKADGPLHVVLEQEGSSLIETLQELHARVGEVLDAFGPEFR